MVDNRLLRYHPMLEGILLNECVRLGQHSFANKLISLFNQFKPDLRHKLMWLYWYDLMLGFPSDDWLNALKMKTEEQLVEWIIGRQMENWGLTRIMCCLVSRENLSDDSIDSELNATSPINVLTSLILANKTI